jgi:hypothetical protein
MNIAWWHRLSAPTGATRLASDALATNCPAWAQLLLAGPLPVDASNDASKN